MRLPAAVGSLVRQPSVTAVAVLTLGLGIGANTAMFTVVNAVLLRPLPYRAPDRVMAATERAAKFPSLSASWQNYVDWRDQNHVFETLAAYRPLNVTITGGDQPDRVPAKMLTATMLPMLGVRPVTGRVFSAEDDRAGAQPVAMVGHGFWVRTLGAASNVLGRTLIVDAVPTTIVGVLPASFDLVQPADVYIPMGPWASTLPDDRSWHPGIFPLGRLRAGVTVERAREEMDTLGRRLAREYAATNIALGVNVTPLHEQIVKNVRTALLVLLGAVGAVLLIACVNVANILLARTVDRQREFAVRSALGAGRWAVVRQLLAENLVLALIGGASGIVVAWFGVSSLVSLAGASLPGADRIAIDARVLAFSLLCSLGCGLLFGAAPALTASRIDIRHALNEESRGAASSARGRRLRAVLVVSEVAMATMLLVGAGLLLRSFTKLQAVPPGFDPTRLLVVDLPMSPAAYATDEQRGRLVDAVLARAAALPGAKQAGVTTTLPMAGGGATLHFNIHGRPPKGPDEYTLAGYRAVTAGYLPAIGVPLLRGRLFDDRDRRGSAPVALVNQTLARRFFPGHDPIGQRLQIGATPDEAIPWMEVVGVVGDVRQSFDSDAQAEMFVPYLQGAPDPILGGLFRNVSVVVRTAGDPAQAAGAVREMLRDVDRDQPIVRMRTMEDAIGASVSAPRFRTTLVGLFALAALVLAVVGVYGVTAYGVSQRRQEIGLRMALGAQGADVMRLVMGQGVGLVVVGTGVGLAVGFGVARLLETLLFDTQPADPVAFAVVVAVLAVASLVASYLPARRAMRVDPLVALR